MAAQPVLGIEELSRSYRGFTITGYMSEPCKGYPSKPCIAVSDEWGETILFADATDMDAAMGYARRTVDGRIWGRNHAR